MTSSSKKTLFEIFFIVLMAFLPFSFALNLFSSIDIALVRVLIPLFFIFWLFSSFWRKNFLLDTRFRVWFLIFIFLLATFSISWSINTEKAWRKVLFLGSIFPVYWLAFFFLKKKINKELFLKTILFTSFITALIGLIQFLSQFILGLESVLAFQQKISPFFLGRNFAATVNQYNSWLVNIDGKTIFRSLAFFPDPHLFSLFLNITLPIGLYLFWKEKKIFYLIASFFILIASLLSFSRAGYLSLIIGFFFCWFFVFKQIAPLKNLILITGILLVFIFPNPFKQRFFSSFNNQDNSVKERLSLWSQGWKITKSNFWTGVGIGNLSETIEPFSDQRIPIYAHNLFLDFSAEIGFFGGVILFLIIVSPIATFLLKPQKENLFLAIIFIVILTHSMFETPFYSIRVLPLILSLLAL